MKRFNTPLITLLVTSLLLVGCTQSTATATAAPTQDIMALVEQTVAAKETELALIPTSTQAVPTELPTFTSVPTFAPTATMVPPTEIPAPELMVSDVVSLTIPNGTTLKGGQTFLKTWRITNGGTAAWDSNYKIVFVNGDSMGVNSITLGKIVYPGYTYEVSVTFTAPVGTGSHTANFMMMTDNGFNFGMGPNFDRPWSIVINVQNVFAVTSASITASPTSYHGACPATIKLTPKITANGSGIVTYYVRTSNAPNNTDTYSLTFTASGTQTGPVISWPINSSMTELKVNVYIDNPNHQDFQVLTIPITCTP